MHISIRAPAAGRATTLVVETAGFKDGGWLDINGSPLTDQGRTIERFRRTNFGTIEVEQTIDDPKAYTRPFTTRLTWRLMPDTEIMEMVCLENNRSIDHILRGPEPTRKNLAGPAPGRCRRHEFDQRRPRFRGKQYAAGWPAAAE